LPYQRILEDLLASVPGAQAALLLDAEGEAVIATGDGDERHRLIAAYSGIALGAALRALPRLGVGGLQSLVWRHERGTVVVTPLKDGYFLVFSLGPAAVVASGIARSQDARGLLEAEI
jgi:predicted regulator of Ras-like GTPase activity (Roadblock/LC7/MglB family)